MVYFFFSPAKPQAKKSPAKAGKAKTVVVKKPTVPETLRKKQKLNTERKARGLKLRLFRIKACHSFTLWVNYGINSVVYILFCFYELDMSMTC